MLSMFVPQHFSLLLLSGSQILQTRAGLQLRPFRRCSSSPIPWWFVRLCAPLVAAGASGDGLQLLHDYAAATVEDTDLREALLRGISETGVPTIETDWVPPSKQSEIGATFTKIAKPTLQCMFEPSTN